MKKILSVLLALAMLLSMTVLVNAEGEIEIALTQDNWGANAGTAVDAVTWGEGTITANELGQFSLKLPTTCVDGDTVVLHIKGSAEDNFRVWLLAANAGTASNQWKSADAGYAGTGEFEFYIELTCQYYDVDFETAEDVNFKAPSWDGALTNFTLDYVGVLYGTMADVEAGKVIEVQPQIDAAQALVDAVKAVDATDSAALDAAVAAAQTAIDAIPDYGFTALIDAKAALQLSVNTVLGEVALGTYQSYIDTVNTALENAKAAGNDTAAIKAAYDEALAAVNYMEDNGGDLEPVKAKVVELKEVINEIKDLHKAATAANAEEKAAAEAAAKEAEEKAAADALAKEQATNTAIIIGVIAVVVVVVVVVVLVVLKKKKK